MIFVVTGPSGCGKSTLIGRVLADVAGLRFSVSHTTGRGGGPRSTGANITSRPGRCSTPWSAPGEFVEWAEVHGHRYGTSRAEVREGDGDVVLDIDVQGARQIRKSGLPATLVFVMPPVFSELRRRLEARGTDGPDAVERRLGKAREEVLEYRDFNYVIVNEVLETAVEELRSIIRAERCRPGARKERIDAILRSFSDEERR